MAMYKIFTDINARTSDGMCWVLKYRGEDLDQLISPLKLAKGDKVILYQDEDDFEVVATLDFKFVPILARDAWIAVPDWSTLVRKGG